MAYQIEAWLGDDGSPHLRLIDSHSGCTRLSWAADGQRGPELKSLFHELMLLSAGDRVASQFDTLDMLRHTARRE